MKANLFRFVVNRPPQRISDEEVAEASVPTHPPNQPQSALLNDLLRLRGVDDREGMRSRARLFLRQNALRNLDELQTPMKAFDQWLSERQRDLSAESFLQFVENLINIPIAKFVTSNDYLDDRLRAADTLLAFMIAGRQNGRVPALLARTIRIFGVLEQFIRDEKHLLAPGRIEQALKAFILLPGALYPLPPPRDRQAGERERAYNERLEAYKLLEKGAKEIVANIARHETAIAEIMAGYDLDCRRDRARIPEDTPIERAESSSGNDETIILASRTANGDVASTLSISALDLLSSTTTNLLVSLRVDVTHIDVVETVMRLENRLATLARDLNEIGGDGEDPPFVMIGGAMASAEDFAGVGAVAERPPGSTAGCPLPDNCRPKEPKDPEEIGEELDPGPGELASLRASTGDLMVVEQTLQRYELGEVAHIENVLQGERKDRTHRRTETSEEITVIETEEIKSTEHDLQTAERFELQTESAKVINEDASLRAGLNVSGRYGPSVNFTANASYGRDTSREESNSTATSFSRDVTERAVSRIQERVLERHTRRELLEVEETNLHQLNNTLGDDNIAGVYRWVDKIYKAQVINYGLRAQIEIMVPEPAGFLKFAMANWKSAEIDLRKPRMPGYCKQGTSTFVRLTARDICRSNYLFWVARYGAVGVKPPPPSMKIVGKAFDNKNVYKSLDTVSDGEIRVPDGYRAQRAWIIDGLIIRDGETNDQLRAYIGRRFLTNNGGNNTAALNNEDGDLPVSLAGINMLAYAINIEVECRIAQETYEEWQLATFEAIMIAYNDRVADYEEQLAARQIEQGVEISGNNPLRNVQLIRDELKRSSISIISGQHFDYFDALRKNVGDEGYPQLLLPKVTQEGPYIRFFEQAFEWEHIAYLLYPYYWGLKDDWTKNILLEDNDPVFAEFLRAGAARVVVPVRPGFEDAVAGFLSHGWLIADGEDQGLPEDLGLESGNDLPILSLLAEVKARQGYNGMAGEGTVDVTNGSVAVSCTGTNFTADDDTGREIHIQGWRHVIASVTSETEISLDEPYAGPTQSDLPYALGVQYIGEPWQVRVPTPLVFLENDQSSLPEFDQ